MLTANADEPRRSGRATKGQHKNLELPETPAKKGKGKGQKDKGSKTSAEPTPAPSEAEEEEIIRCICGEYEEEEDVERDMICCDSCLAWQHNDCMGLTFAKGSEPDTYFCERCKPENHKALLEKIAKGEKPWEQVAERRRQEAEEKKSKKKKGKKGSTRKSQGKADSGTPGRAGTSATPGPGQSPAPGVSASAEPEKNGHDSRRSSTNKRKLDEQAETDMGPQVKQQRVSPQSTAASSKVKTEPSTNASAAGGTVEELVIPARKSAATALIKLFVEQVTAAQKKGSYSLPSGQNAEDAARQLGLTIEDAMYNHFCGRAGEPTEPYKLQLRTILFNVKKNPSLRDRLLVGSLSPDLLSRMKPEEMASEELQQKDAEIKRESERQHIIIQEQGPRIRRTHKGEELIEDDVHNAATESVFSTAPRRSTVEGADGSPGNQSPTTPKLPQPKGRGGQRQGQSPTGEHHDHVFPEVATHIREPVPHGKIQADAEIDQLLRDDEPDSPPYSPKDFSDDGIVWRGKLAMIPVAEFTSSAKHVGGADLSGRIPWSQLAPSTLLIDGRIDIQLASNYLCGLRFSASTDVSVLAVSSPDHPTERAGFDKLFEYFSGRKRYGVIGKHPLPAVKDTYIVPIEAGTTNKPEFIELLENNSLEGPINERTLLIVFVVKTGDSNPSSVQPPSHQPSLEPASSASPLTAVGATPQSRQFSTPGHAPAAQVEPTPPSNLGSSTSFGQQPSQIPGYQQPAMTGMAAAVQMLGSQVSAPAIQQLLKTAPNVDVAQLNVVRDILNRQPAAAGNYDTLMQALFETQANGHAPQPNA
ncbi:hypothetical protein PENDEC_c013G05980 [Penicillium decumbens]|uniref:Transcription factor BYE1 n=1 Tax=Penicillium decumbens TaxID=69771 RepID=A0A1V6P9Z4_PENDC|nr:hypothetical protein PENDEC_c013G05980 [Penicillium decumbens]